MRKPPFNDINVRKRNADGAGQRDHFGKTYWKGQADATPQGVVGVKGYYIPFEEWDEEVKQGLYL